MAKPSAEEVRLLTPMMRQYFEVKKDAGDSILFFRMGDFYEIFGDDALEVAPKLDIVLTSREKGEGQKIPFCGVPHHSAKNYWMKLIALGYKVAIADQVEDASKSKGLVKRAVTKIFTPGCIDELEALDAKSPNYLMGIYEDPASRSLSLAVADISTGELRSGLIGSKGDILQMVRRFRPREIITRRFFQQVIEESLENYLASEKVVFGSLAEAILRDGDEQAKILRDVLGPQADVGSLGPLLAGMFSYFDNLHASTSQFTSIRPLLDPEVVELNDVTIRDLELFKTVRRGSREGSLFHEIDCTRTPMGGRLLHHSLLNPFRSRQMIQARQDKVAFFVKEEKVLMEVREILKSYPDIERLMTRVLSSRLSPTELHKFTVGLQKARSLGVCLEPFQQNKADSRSIQDFLTPLGLAEEICLLLEDATSDDPSQLVQPLGIIKSGYDRTFDELKERALNGETQIRAYESSLKAKTKIPSLKVKRHKTYGLLIEVTKTHLKKVPEEFIRRQTMVNTERYSTFELMELDESLSQALVLAQEREQVLYEQLLARLAKKLESIKFLVASIAQIDLIQGLAYKAIRNRYVCPQISLDASLQLRASRHPVVERFVGRHQFVANDVTIEQSRRTVLITGPNMGGKSTVMRQTALCALLHQIGSFVPCESAVMPIFDSIYTRVGASDDLANGQSTFMVEMTEAALILRNATDKSLVILDEVGRGTSTTDGMALAQAILEDLTERVGCFVMFATHFHELVEKVGHSGKVSVKQAEVLDGEKIQFTHRFIDGAANSSFGLEVARLAGIPQGVIGRAVKYLGVEKNTKGNQGRVVGVEAEGGEAPLALITDPLSTTPQGDNVPNEQYVAIIDKLIRMNLNRTTPLQALNRLHQLQEDLSKTKQFALFNN